MLHLTCSLNPSLPSSSPLHTHTQVREAQDKRSLQASKRVRQGAARQVAVKGGGVRWEVRLESKKYRGTSRRKAKQQLAQEEEE
jgi:hypothetical protein